MKQTLLAVITLTATISNALQLGVDESHIEININTPSDLEDSEPQLQNAGTSGVNVQGPRNCDPWLAEGTWNFGNQDIRQLTRVGANVVKDGRVIGSWECVELNDNGVIDLRIRGPGPGQPDHATSISHYHFSDENTLIDSNNNAIVLTRVL